MPKPPDLSGEASDLSPADKALHFLERVFKLVRDGAPLQDAVEAVSADPDAPPIDIDTEAIRLTALQAAWRLSAGLPAAEAVAVAKFWAAEGGQRVVHAAQHLHGGIGVDRDYPLHRYFLWAKHLELTLGGATPQLLRLGAMLAADPV